MIYQINFSKEGTTIAMALLLFPYLSDLPLTLF